MHLPFPIPCEKHFTKASSCANASDRRTGDLWLGFVERDDVAFREHCEVGAMMQGVVVRWALVLALLVVNVLAVMNIKAVLLWCRYF
jgi:hypothetical protein